jgi:hypothetical protein
MHDRLNESVCGIPSSHRRFFQKKTQKKMVITLSDTAQVGCLTRQGRGHSFNVTLFTLGFRLYAFFWQSCPFGFRLWLVYLQQNKKKTKTEGVKKCHFETMMNTKVD